MFSVGIEMEHWREMTHVFQTLRMMQDESDTNKTYSALNKEI